MRRFLLRLVWCILPIITVLVTSNFFGDSASLFRIEYEETIAELILDGSDVTNISNYDERLLQKELILKEEKTFNTIVLGSSRTMLIGSEIFDDQSFFNYSISHAKIQDFIAIYAMCKAQKKLPKKIIIGIDPWTFNDNDQSERWRSIGEYYYSFVKKDIKREIIVAKYLQLFSVSYFQNSVFNIPKVVSGKDRPRKAEHYRGLTNTKLQDGSLRYSVLMSSASMSEIDTRVDNYLNRTNRGIEDFEVVSRELWNDFDKLVNDIINNGIELEFFLAPYHPRVYQIVQQDFKNVLYSELRVRQLSDLMNIKVYGSFDPDKLNINSTDFLDAVHLRYPAIVKLLANSSR